MTVHDIGCSRKDTVKNDRVANILISCRLCCHIDSVFTEFISQPEMRAL
jgi:hypothetical protein